MSAGRGLVLAVGILTAACPESSPSVVGRWQRVGQPREWIQFTADGAFSGRSYMDTLLIRGRFEQRDSVVTGTSVYGHTRRLVLRDTILVMEDGTRYTRVR